MRFELILSTIIGIAGLVGAFLSFADNYKKRRLVQIVIEIEKNLAELKKALAASDTVRISFIDSELRRLRQEYSSLSRI